MIKHLVWLAEGCSQKVISGAGGIRLSAHSEENGCGPGSAQRLGKPPPWHQAAEPVSSGWHRVGTAPGSAPLRTASCTGWLRNPPEEAGAGAGPVSIPSSKNLRSWVQQRMLSASPTPAWLRTRRWDPEWPCTYRLASQCPWLGARGAGRPLRAIRLQGKRGVWLCIPIKTSPFAAAVKLPCKMPANPLEGPPPKSCCLHVPDP